MRKRRNSALFLDRDGVINRKAKEGDYIKSGEEFQFLRGAKGAIRKLNKKGFLVIVVSNQRGVSKGIMTEADLKEIDTKMQEGLRKVGARIDGIYYCPHDIPDHCGCRKPAPGLLFRAAKEQDIDLDRSWIIGDSPSDIEAGKRAGCKTIFIRSSPQQDSDEGIQPDFIARSLAEAVDEFLV